jgi:predicted acyl esterase
VGALALVFAVAAACSTGAASASAASPGTTTAIGVGVPVVASSFTVTPGVEQVIVTKAAPKAALTLVDKSNTRLLTLVADDKGQAAFSLVPDQYLRFETGTGAPVPSTDGGPVRPGDGYTIVNESVTPQDTSAPFAVYGRDDHPDPALYDRQKLTGVPWTIGGAPADGHSVEEGVNYITTRDGTTLSAMVRFPERSIYGDGPYPTVVEYSGYDPSNPESPQPGTRLAHALGFATVGVNMRGSGCSGGVFDVFNTAQQADGYDVIEAVARQPWAKNQKVGMVGLSYSGITQLYVAATRPPSLAAITPLSVIEDPWKMTRPGGIYNAGFTKQWLEERDREAKADGQGWAQKRARGGDQRCADNQSLRSQNIDFEKFSKSLEFRPPATDSRDLSKLVSSIDVPVYLTGAWQDEQTGPRFATMLANFTGTTNKHFVLYNGHHPDGYTPYNISRWYEFLSLYVAQQVPRMAPIIRAGLPPEIGKAFGDEKLQLQPDRFADLRTDQLAEARAVWEADPVVRVLFEWGTGVPGVPGAPEPGFVATFPSWPPPNVQPWTLYLDAAGRLAPTAPATAGADSYRYDPAAGGIGYAAANAYDFQAPTVKADWTNAPDGKGLSYLTEPLAQDTVIAGPGYADLWFKADQDDADIEVVLSEVHPDGTEFRVQNGLLRAGDRKVDTSRSDQFLIQQSYAAPDYQKLPHGEFTEVKVPIFPVAQPLRAGSRLRLQVNTPGRDLPLWFFETSSYGNDDARYTVSRGGAQASSLVLPVLPAGTVAVPAARPPCPSLRGQVCRTYTPSTNQPG